MELIQLAVSAMSIPKGKLLLLERFGSAMPGRQRQVLKKILSCRTPALGGQLFGCPDCPGFQYRYHSCNDRHCPQCGQTDADAWLERQGARLLLPVPYFLITSNRPSPFAQNATPLVRRSDLSGNHLWPVGRRG